MSVSELEREFITREVTLDPLKTDAALSDLVLVEVEDPAHEFDVGLLRQQGSEQVPWLERYFSGDGAEFLAEEKPDLTEYLVCFFIHHFDPSEAIVSPYGVHFSSPSSVLPVRFREACKYEHPG